MGEGSSYAPMSGPRYAGIATFMRTPLVRDPSELDIALIGVPFDGGDGQAHVGQDADHGDGGAQHSIDAKRGRAKGTSHKHAGRKTQGPWNRRRHAFG